MARRRKRVIGASRLKRKMKRLPDEMQKELRGEITNAGEELLFVARQKVNVSDETIPTDWEGNAREHLRDALEIKFAKDGLRVRVGIITKRVRKVFFFARFLEFGFRKAGKRYRFPFLFPAWRSIRENVRKDLARAAHTAFSRVANSRPSDA